MLYFGLRKCILLFVLNSVPLGSQSWLTMLTWPKIIQMFYPFKQDFYSWHIVMTCTSLHERKPLKWFPTFTHKYQRQHTIIVYNGCSPGLFNCFQNPLVQGLLQSRFKKLFIPVIPFPYTISQILVVSIKSKSPNIFSSLCKVKHFPCSLRKVINSFEYLFHFSVYYIHPIFH